MEGGSRAASYYPEHIEVAIGIVGLQRHAFR
jgi:hypothetical protein